MTSSFSNFQDFNSLLADFDLSSVNALTLVHINIRSARKYWDQFCVTVNFFKSLVDVWVLTETNLPKDLISQFSLPGYREFIFVRPCRTGGGISIFVKDSWEALKLNFTFNHAECLALNIFNSRYSLTVVACYRPPSERVSLFLEELRASLTGLQATEHICLLGDFNIDTLNPTKAVVCDYLNILAEFGLVNSIQAPTREEHFNGSFVTSCLDHINVRAHGVSVKSAVVSQKLADHYFTVCQLLSKDSVKTTCSKKRQVKIFDRKAFDNLIASYDWDNFLRYFSQQEIYSKFIQLWRTFTDCSTKVIIVKKRRPELAWLNDDIIAAIKYKELLWTRSRQSPKNEELRIKFKIERNRVTAMIKSAKRIYVSCLLSTTWSLVNNSVMVPVLDVQLTKPWKSISRVVLSLQPMLSTPISERPQPYRAIMK